MPLGNGGSPRMMGQKRGTPPKRRYSTAIAFTPRRHATRYAMANVYIYMAVNIKCRTWSISSICKPFYYITCSLR